MKTKTPPPPHSLARRGRQPRRPRNLTQPREVRRHGQHSVAPGCKFRDYRRRSRRAGSMNQNRDGSRQRRTPMKWMLTMLAAGTCAGAFTALAAPVQAADMSLTRLDCGTPQAPVAVNQRFSDIYAYGDLKLQFVYSCYLIKHGDDYLLWDTGHAMTTPNVAPKVSIVDQLEKIGVKADQIKYVGISHYHGDHTGQVGSFPKATLLIGSREWDAITSPKPAEGVNFKPFENWAKGEGK